MSEAVRRLQSSDLFTGDLKIRVARHDLTFPYPLHWHDFYEITLVIGGNGTSIVNGQAQRIARGTMILLTPSDFHEVIPDPSTVLDLYNLNFAQAIIPDGLLEQIFLRRAGSTVLFDETEMADVQFRLQTLKREIDARSPGRELAARNDLERILIEWHRRTASGAVASCDPGGDAAPGSGADRRVQRALVYIHRHYRRPITLAQVAGVAGVSPNHFSDVFRRRVGMTYQGYVKELRLEFARHWLHDAALAVTEIAFLAGFGTLSHFDRLFRRRFGQSPTQYRNGVNDLSRAAVAPAGDQRFA